MESPTEPFEHAEHAEHVAHSGDSRLIRVSITIAVIAVIAATVSSLESMETAATIGSKNEAVLAQGKASDAWSYYQAKSVKENIYSAMAELGGEKASSLSDKAARYADEKKKIEQDARHLEEKTTAANEAAEVHERRHHILTLAVTLLHISIAIATIAIILSGMLWPWRTAVGLSAAGAAIVAYAYLT
jgi:hypothetical protein